MLSLDTAHKLKNAGLQWEPKRFDLFAAGDEIYEVLEVYTCEGDIKWIRGMGGCAGYTNRFYNTNRFTWLPRLDQLLAEIEARGYEWRLEYSEVDGLNDYHCLVSLKGENKFWGYGSESPKEVAAQALL